MERKSHGRSETHYFEGGRGGEERHFLRRFPGSAVGPSHKESTDAKTFGCLEVGLGTCVRVRVTLRLAVYRQRVRLGAKPLEDHDQRYFWHLDPCGHSPYVTFSLTRRSLSSSLSNFPHSAVSPLTPALTILLQCETLR
jgi:hypothetical protein